MLSNGRRFIIASDMLDGFLYSDFITSDDIKNLEPEDVKVIGEIIQNCLMAVIIKTEKDGE